MQGIELVESRLFKVVKITDRDGIEKHHHATQTMIYEKLVKVYGLKEGRTAVLEVQENGFDSGLALYTSTVESVNSSISSGLPMRLVIKTRNTIYTLDEIAMNNGKDIYHGSSPSVLFFDKSESELTH